MPRPNQERAVTFERNLAKRIQREREQRGWTYEALARRMTDAGCTMQPSAVHKIEKGSPPRRITVDEAVTFAGVFGMTLNDLLQPPEVAATKRAMKLWERLGDVNERLIKLRTEYGDLTDRLLNLLDEESGGAALEAIMATHGEDAVAWIQTERTTRRFNQHFGRRSEG
jgi:transcriptional regulator with XRE-family HTH domain